MFEIRSPQKNILLVCETEQEKNWAPPLAGREDHVGAHDARGEERGSGGRKAGRRNTGAESGWERRGCGFDPRSCNFFHQDPLNSTHPGPPKFTTFSRKSSKSPHFHQNPSNQVQKPSTSTKIPQFSTQRICQQPWTNTWSGSFWGTPGHHGVYIGNPINVFSPR